MNSRGSQSIRLFGPFRWLAIALPMLVIGLGLMAVRPDWHLALHVPDPDVEGHAHAGHSHDTGTNELGCAIELFASGLVEILGTGSTLGQINAGFSFTLTFPDDPLVLASGCLEPPGRAPPQAS